MAIANLKGDEFSEREKRNLAILETLRRFGPITRPEISRALGLNIVTVSNYIEEFINKNLVFEKEFDISEGGRRPILLDVNPDSGLVIGVGVNLLNIVGALVDLKGRIVARSSLERKDVGVKNVVNYIIEAIAQTLNKSRESHGKIKGIGIGIAGIVNKKDGSVRWPEKVGNHYDYASVFVPLKNIVEREFGYPVLLENDATAACFGEQWLDLEPGIKNVIYMFSGVGCGIMINGAIYTGASGSAGEVSIYNPKEDAPFTCPAGSPCFLKRWEIDFGMLNEARARITQSRDPESIARRLLELCESSPEKINLKHIFQAAKELTAQLHIPYHFISKILQDLTNKKLLYSHTGPTGGFALARSPKDILFIEIVEAMNQKEPFEGLILGGTEIPLLIKPTDIPDKVLFDTTEIHVQALLQLMLE